MSEAPMKRFPQIVCFYFLNVYIYLNVLPKRFWNEIHIYDCVYIYDCIYESVYVAYSGI
jgi:hypothetical protein